MAPPRSGSSSPTAPRSNASTTASPAARRCSSADRRSDGFVVGTFELVEQPGVNRCGERTGQLRFIAVMIEGDRISRWSFTGPGNVA